MDNQTQTPATDSNTKHTLAILLAYSGAGFQGMQKNPGAKTIESDLHHALYLSNAISQPDRDCPKRFHFARAARTDKGVSALGQVVSGKFKLDSFVEGLNDRLGDRVRVFGVKRVANTFSAKKSCDRRRYVYLLPAFALDCKAHRDRESVLASVGSGSDLVRCWECSERGRKVEVRSGGSSNTCSANKTSLGNDRDNKHNLDPANENVFHYGDKEKERFNKILKQYVGTHNFHNFTTKMNATDPAAKRCIISFCADTTVTIDGIEFVKCEVVGQSFMLHQIRKMIGVAVAVMRNCASESFIQTALQQDVKVNVPTAPEVGLYLEECFFTNYNQKCKDTHEEVSMKDYVKEAEEFKLKHIYPYIASTEHKEGTIAVWLHSLNHRNYPDLEPEENSGANEASGSQTEKTTGCKWDRYRSHISPSCFVRHPIHYYEKTTIHEVDLEHLATAMKTRLNVFFPYIHELRVRYGGISENDITNKIICDVNMMVDAALSVTYNRLRFILQNHDPIAFAARMNPKSPLSNKFKFPAFISSVLGSIGPLRDDFQDTLIVYATSADRSQTFGRAQNFDFISGHFYRLIDNLVAIGVPLAPIDVKRSSIRSGWFFSTLLVNHEEGLWDFTATCHYSKYKHRDIASAWMTLNDDPALRAFPDCSLRYECCTDPDVVNAVIASRPEGVPDDVDGATAPARPSGLVFNVNGFGVRPAVAAEGGSRGVYILGRGTKRYNCTTLGRNLNEHDMVSMLREYILMYDSSWIDKSF
ncbi:uncharacterized protein LOC143597661 [Bidens hawaiensis]|uniref:uncharacterized protein LOC143597661 n=1 Tax=Bidens hawaiensis TaxID=980011 RepID=UPI00404A9C48